MRKFHLEIDERRKSGDLKGALDLARYAHAQLPHHQLIKRSYAWALYSYLKQKISSNLPLLSSDDWTPNRVQSKSDHLKPQLLSDHPRRREINLLCREYRRHKLPTSDLCLSLFLRQLCRIHPAPLGLYGLLKWTEITGLRSEDHIVDPERPHAPPLIGTLALKLSSIVSLLDQERVAGLNSRVEPEQVATLSAQLYETLITSEQHSDHNTYAWFMPSIWGACRLNRRSGRFNNGLKETITWIKSLVK